MGADHSFSVLTMNLRFGLAKDGENCWENRKKSLALLLGDRQMDFMAFQEANGFQVDFIREILNGPGVIGQRMPAPDFWQNNVIFFSPCWECLQYEHFFLSPTPFIPSRSRKSRWPRQCTIGLFKKENRKLICINTHFDFSAEVRVESAGIILERANRFSEKIPCILMGDFNTTPSSACYRVFTRADSSGKPENGRFQNIFSRPYPGTYHGFTGRSTGKHIDWILYRGGLKPIKQGIIKKAYGNVYPSDHFPLFSVFGWDA